MSNVNFKIDFYEWGGGANIRPKITARESTPLCLSPFKNSLNKKNVYTLVTRIEDPLLLLATLPLFHPVQALKTTPLLQFTPIHFPKSTPLPLFTPICNFEALLGASLI